MLVTGKPLMLCGAIGVPGGGVGIYGMYCWYDVSYPNNNRTLTDQGYIWNIPDPKLGTSISSPNQVFEDRELHGCFKNFFPGIAVKRYYSKENDGYTKSESGSLPQLNEDLSSTTSQDKDTIGCAIMDFSFLKNQEDTDSKNSWSFNAEVTVRNENFGWALWVTGNRYLPTSTSTTSSSFTRSLLYSLVFLKKNEMAWDILGGYSWFDYGFSVTTGTNYHIKVPKPSGDSVDWFDEGKALEKGKTLNRTWSGIWREDNTGKGVFEDIEIWEGSNKSDAAEIFGMSASGFSTNTMGYTQVRVGYKKSDSTWIKYGNDSSTGESIKNTLDKLYEPFKDKKGKWVEFSKVEEECGRLQSSRSNLEADLKYLKSFCYTKVS